MQRKRFYVYLLIDPRNSKPFYVGKGAGCRIGEHERLLKQVGAIKHNQKLERKIKKIWDANMTVVRRKVFRGTERECLNEESRLIARIGLSSLCNLTPGGIGGDLISQRFAGDAAMRKKWRDVQFVRWTPQARREFGEKIKHVWRTRASYRASLYNRLRKRWRSKANRLKQKRAFKRYWADPKNRIRQRANSTRNWLDPEIRKRRIAGLKRSGRHRRKEKSH